LISNIIMKARGFAWKKQLYYFAMISG
jgi:hypothetical protein